MYKYLIVQLDDRSVSYCHYTNIKREYKLINIEDLKKGILLAMKENLMVQFLYPDYELPQEYKDLIETVDHCKIASLNHKEAEVIVVENWDVLPSLNCEEDKVFILRTTNSDLFKNHTILTDFLYKSHRLNIMITDIDSFKDKDFIAYKELLDKLVVNLKDLYGQGLAPQLNLLTDRMVLDGMNNCNAGWENITLAPNGKFYICPAFYLENEANPIGDLLDGMDIKNPQLYQLNYAPLCRGCDAYQCKRCVWLNQKTTLEVNTPSHEQCVVAHLERNASRGLLSGIRTLGNFLPDKKIREIDYLDPFEVIGNL